MQVNVITAKYVYDLHFMFSFYLIITLFCARLETLRKHARRRLGLDLVEPSKPKSLDDDDDYVITPATTALKSTVASSARAQATFVQQSKVERKFIFSEN